MGRGEALAEVLVVDADLEVEVEVGAGCFPDDGLAGFADEADDLSGGDLDAFGDVWVDCAEVGVAGDDAGAVVDPDLAAAEAVEDGFAAPAGLVEGGPFGWGDFVVLAVGADDEAGFGGEDLGGGVDRDAGSPFVEVEAFVDAEAVVAVGAREVAGVGGEQGAGLGAVALGAPLAGEGGR